MKIIFNTTFHVEDEVHDEFIQFVKDYYIVNACSSGSLIQPMLAIIHSQHEEAGKNYSLQFRVKNIDSLNRWMQVEGETLQNRLASRFGDKVAGFITLLEEVEI